LEVLGEAANQLTDVVRSMAPEIPWPRLISLRNRLIYEYHGVNWEVLLPILFNDLPVLQAQLEALRDIAPQTVETDG
jgi:uncharacterized protein with HEPN domain